MRCLALNETRGDAVVRALASHQCVPGSIPGPDVICGVEFVVGSLPCSEGFFSGYSGFPLSLKTDISKFQCDPDYCQALYHEPLARVIAQALNVFGIKFAFTFFFKRMFLFSLFSVYQLLSPSPVQISSQRNSMSSQALTEIHGKDFHCFLSAF